MSWSFSLPKTFKNVTILGNFTLNNVTESGSLDITVKTQIKNLDAKLKSVIFLDLESRVFDGETNYSKESENFNVIEGKNDEGLRISEQFNARF